MMTQVEATVKELARSPLLPLVERRLHALMEDEQRRRAEFQRAVDAGDSHYDGKSIEFINGEIIEAMPTKKRHWNVGQYLLQLLQAFVGLRRLGEVGYEKAMISLSRNDYEPDICFWTAAKASKFTPNQARFPAPDFIVEILSPSTEKIDRDIKFKDYAAHGVAEYWIVDPERRLIEQYVLQGDEYKLHTTITEGNVTCTVVAGFKFPLDAIFDADANLAALQQLMADAK